MIDPRAVHARRIVERVGRVYAITSSKGGVGKTTIACALSLILARRGYKVGLLDSDFTNATAHVVLGVDAESSPVEEGLGVKPLLVDGVKLATPTLFTRGNPLGLRGSSAVDALRELLVAVEWGDIDVLVLDMPPGVKDELFEAIALGAKPVVVSTQDALSVASVRKLLRLLRSEKVASAGVIENMARTESPLLLEDSRLLGYKHLGVLPYDESLRELGGDRGRLLESRLARSLAGKLDEILSL